MVNKDILNQYLDLREEVRFPKFRGWFFWNITRFFCAYILAMVFLLF